MIQGVYHVIQVGRYDGWRRRSVVVVMVVVATETLVVAMTTPRRLPWQRLAVRCGVAANAHHWWWGSHGLLL